MIMKIYKFNQNSEKKTGEMKKKYKLHIFTFYQKN